MSRATRFLSYVAKELGSRSPRELYLAAFLALYTRIDGSTLVLDPIERELRRELWFVVKGGSIEPLAPPASLEASSSADLDRVLVERVRDSCRLVKELGAEAIESVVLELLGWPSDGAAVEPLVERIIEVSRDVDRFLDLVSTGDEVMEFGEATSAI